MEEIQVTTTHYKAEDGRVFKSKEDCIHYEEIKSGKRRVCALCNGRGCLSDSWCRVLVCTVCNGKGYQRKELAEVWI